MLLVGWLLWQAALAASKCPAGSVQGLTSDDCYQFTGPLSWMEAEETCQNRGGHLASASNASVNALLTLPAKQVCSYGDGSHQYWIGASIGLLSTTWSWSDETRFRYQNWAKGSSSTGDNELRCAVTDATSSYWSSLDCMEEKPFICRVPARYDVPATSERPPKTTCPSEWTYFAPSKKMLQATLSTTASATVAHSPPFTAVRRTTSFRDSWSECIDGLVGIDVITLGGFSIANAPFGQATKIPTSRDDLALPMEQLGLGPAQTSDEDWDYIARNPVVATMAKENSMEPIFSLWFNRSNPDPFDRKGSYAEITYGSTNDHRCGNWSYAPLQFGSYTQDQETVPGWNVTLNSLRFGNYSFSLPEGYGFNLTVSLSRDSTFIVGSQRVFNELLGLLGANDNQRFFCDTVWPTLILNLSGTTVELPGNTLIYQEWNYGGMCVLDAVYGDGDSWGLGINFLRQYCVSVDYGTSRLWHR